MKRNILLAALFGFYTLASAQTVANYQTVPMPRSVEQHDGSFVLNPENAKNAVRTHIDSNEKRWAMYPVPAEAYEIEVSKEGIDITAMSEAGIYNAQQMLRKAMLLPERELTGVMQNYELPYVTIKDGPEFPYRGVHLDCSRHFFPLEFIKKYIDIAALHGCNRMHWHLTDDQGWRFEVKRYPLLNQVGSRRPCTVVGHNLPLFDGTPHEGYYTQEECREIVRYAAERHIEVMPEIDLPGHMVAALASYPQLGCTGGPYEVWTEWGVADDVLCAGNPEALDFVRGVLEELIDVFPSKMIHLGGDECPKVRWEVCNKCQKQIKRLDIKAEEGKTAEDQLQNWFMHEAEEFLIANGRQMIGWDEILEGGVSETASVMSWRGLQGGIAAARTGHKVIMTPTGHCYLNFYQSENRDSEPFSFDAYLPMSKVYAIPVVPEQLTAGEARYILGCQANLWTEYISSPEQAEWMLLPRLAALSEAMWMPAASRNYERFLERLPRLKEYYKVLDYKCSNKIE